MKEKNESRWAKVKCDYPCEKEDDMFWQVVAWPTDDDNEVCEVIAYIDDLTGRVIYAESEARIDPMAQEFISEKAAECRAAHPFSVKELESVLRDVVDYVLGDPEYARENLDAMGISEEMAKFFGYTPEEEE